MRKIALFTILFLASATSYCQIFILEGQSNARGEADITTIPSDLSAAITGATIFNTASLTWQTLTTSNNSGTAYTYSPDGRFGLELRLMKLLVANYGSARLIKYALGGVPLAQNAGGPSNLDWSPLSSNMLYSQSITNYNSAIAALASNQRTAPIAYIWVQGEQDAKSSVTASAYQTNLQNFIVAKRSAYGLANLPFIIVRLGDQQSTVTYPYQNVVRNAQETVAAQANNYLISADGFVTTDGSHYNAVGYDSLANRIYRTIINITATQSQLGIIKGHRVIGN